MKSILKDDNPELLKQFEKESAKNEYEILIRYLNLHNEAAALKEQGH